MKVFVFIVICIATIYGAPKLSHEIHERMKDWHKECVAELKLDPRILIEDGNATMPSPREATCYQACLDNKFGVVNDDGSYSFERMKAYAETPYDLVEMEKVFPDRIKNCQSQLVGSHDRCKMSACLHNMPKEMWATNQ